MKKLILAAASLVALSSGSAFAADTQSTDVTFSGTVANTCVLKQGVFSAGTNAVLSGTAGGNAGTSTVALTLADATTAALNSAGFTLTYADSYCNYAHKITIKATNGGLLNSTTGNDPVATSGAFVQRIGYDADLKWMGNSFAQGPNPSTSTTDKTGDTSATNEMPFAVNGANRADVVLTVAIASNTNPVVAGTYSETLTIKLAPQP